ncbi:ATP-binding protein [Stenotrophomonas sp. 24(2023)]|uniref:ATP-binding protein n=1 Tax=Stenotrophomonas sp. 24(2023) TaxID=3068324 RepID=UPI0027DF4EA2|nr:ATP-binding protein [Stenotrophomonas sp. 24(2023)]WMJ71156.1 ATP-binding protein [Stenotrophomonas sp. 24(2023)]
MSSNGVRAIVLLMLLLPSAMACAALCPQVVVIGYPADRWPVASMGEGGPEGITAGYLQRLSDRGVVLKLRPLQGGTAAEAVTDGIHALVGWPRNDIPAGWLASRPYLQLPQVIVRRRGAPAVFDLGGLRGQRVAVLSPRTLAGPLHAQAAGARLVPVTDIAEAFTQLAGGTVDAVVANLAEVEEGLRLHVGNALVIAAPAGLDAAFVLAVSPACPDLAQTFNALLGSMSLAEHQALLQSGRQPSAARAAATGPWLRGVAAGLMVLFSVALLQAFGFWRLHREASWRRGLQLRLDEITANLPAVVFQAFRPPSGPLRFPFIAGDVQALFGISTEAALRDPRQLLSAVHADDRDAVQAGMGRASLTATLLELQFRTLSGRWVRAHGLPHAGRDGSVQWQGCWIDVTDHHARAQALAAARRQAEQDAAARSHFLATMSQQIRTPMATLLGLLEQLAGSALDGRQRQVLATVEDAAEVLRQVLDDVLEAPPRPVQAPLLQPVATDVGGLLRAVQRLLAPLADSKGVRLRCMVDPQLQAWSSVDGLRLRQILFNVVGNALKFTEQGQVELVVQVLCIRADGQRVRLQVRDSGIGISPERQQAVFTRFTQAEPSTARRYGGSGLGLSICRELATAMGGQLQLHSTLGEGTTVWLDLDLPAVDAPVASARRVRRATALLPPTRALLAEDHPGNRSLLQGWLRSMGLQVQAVADGRQAWHAWQDSPFDLLVSDWQMPHMDGQALVRSIRAVQPQPVPIVVISACTQAAMPGIVLAAGADVFLPKPVRRQAMQALLARLLAATPGWPALATRMGGLAPARDLLGSLLPCCDQDMQALRQAWQRGDPAAVQVRLHRLRGVLSMVGAPALAERLWALEQQPPGASLAPALATALATVDSYLQVLQRDAGAQ